MFLVSEYSNCGELIANLLSSFSTKEMKKEAYDLQLEFPQLKGAISKAAPKMMVKKRWLDYAEAQAFEEKQRESKF